MTARIGVFLPEGIVLTNEGSIAIDAPPPTLGELFDFARANRLRQIWLTPATLDALGLPRGLPRDAPSSPFLSAEGRTVPASQTVLAPWLSVWGDGHYLEIGIPSWEPRRRDGTSSNPFGDCTFGPELIGEVLEFSEATGTLWRRSGAVTSDAWLREHYRNKIVALELPPIANDGNLEPDLSYIAENFPERWQRARYCHAFDANAMYLGAASSLPLPAGQLCNDQRSPIRRGLTCQSDRPGYWRFGDWWTTTPSANYGEPGLDADEAWYWSESHRYLEPWYKMLRDARRRLLPHGSSPSLEAVKQTYRQGIGRFGSTRRSRENDPLYQPYWRHAVQAEARCRLMRRIDRLSEQPAAVDVDCLYFLTNARNPIAFATRIGLPIGDEIGQFKHKGSMLGRDARDRLSSQADAIASLREGVAA